MLDTKKSTFCANVEANAAGQSLNNGYFRVFGGVKPVGSDVVTSEVLLAELRFGAIAFADAVDGVIVSNPLTPDLNTNALGEPTWFRCVTVDGDSVFDGTIGKTGCNLNIITDSDAPLMVHPGGEFHVGSVSYSTLSVI